MDEEIWKKKYLKYKNKYINLYKQIAGVYTSNLENILQHISRDTRNNMTLIVGMDIFNKEEGNDDLKRSIDLGANYVITNASSYDSSIEINLKLKKNIKQLDFDFNKLNTDDTGIDDLISRRSYIQNFIDITSRKIKSQYLDCQKFSTIIFDISTSKFLSANEPPNNGIYFIYLLYYILLENGGTIYLDDNLGYTISILETPKNKIETNISNMYNKCNDVLTYKNYDNIYMATTALKLICIKKNGETQRNLTYTEIGNINKNHLEKLLVDSTVEYSFNIDDSYPIRDSRYGKSKFYYKITKNKDSRDIILNNFYKLIYQKIDVMCACGDYIKLI